MHSRHVDRFLEGIEISIWPPSPSLRPWCLPNIPSIRSSTLYPLNSDTMSDPLHHDGHQPIPGTVHLIDLEGTMRVEHARSGQKDIVLVPAPSSDPDDPLNWSPRRKALSTTCMCVYTLMVGIASAAIYSILVPISEDTGLTLGDLNSGTGWVGRSSI